MVLEYDISPDHRRFRRPGRLAVWTAMFALVAIGLPGFIPGCDTAGIVDNGGDDDGGDLTDPGAPPVPEGDWYSPTVDTTWQWQLQPMTDGGQINTSYDVDVYDIDLFDVPDAVFDELRAAGRKVICYFSAGSYESFRDDASEFEPTDLGKLLEGYIHERWLDVRSDNVRRIMLARLDHAMARGCDGIEPDNVDGYANDTGLPLTADDQLAYNHFIAAEAHNRELAVGLKNDLDQIPELVDYFDFAVNEQCHEYDECDALQPFIDAGKPVFNAEYQTRFVNNPISRADLCADSQVRHLRTLVLPLDLDDSFRYSCER
jgi:hypothetical protein